MADVDIASALNLFFRYFGAKHRLVGWYPTPRCDQIIEPLAASADYCIDRAFLSVRTMDVRSSAVDSLVRAD